MPNHSTNRFTFKKLTEEQLNKLKDKLKSKNTSIDFNNFVPQKEVVVNWSASNETLKAANIFYRDNPFDLTTDEFKKLFEEDDSCVTKNLIKIDRTIVEVYSKDKHINESDMLIESWYDWNRKHWGTKWNAYDIYIDKDEIIFSTAWGRPYDVIINGIAKIIIDALDQDFNSLEYINYTEGWDDIDYYKWDNNLKELVLVKTEKMEYEYSDEEEE